tara:strand:+ start:421 stop:927 length:507 start_codon:yes stop_codon:yes gene_type:complete
MEQWKVILATMIIFGSGVGTGHLISHKDPSSTLGTDEPKGFQSKTSDIERNITPSTRPIFLRSTGYLDRHLNLSDEQKVQIQGITKKSHQRIHEFGKPFRNQIHLEHTEVQTQIRQLLTPEQTKTFDNLPHFRFNVKQGRPSGRPPRFPEHPHNGNNPPHLSSPSDHP